MAGKSRCDGQAGNCARVADVWHHIGRDIDVTRPLLYDRDIAECYQMGASAVLCKPLSRAIFREEIARVGLIPGSAAKPAFLTVRQ